MSMSEMHPVYAHMRAHGEVLLAGIVGSHAYGLVGPGSDEDRLGVFAAPTMSLVGLEQIQETWVFHEPFDAAFHEAAKYVRLALACNPTIMELLWLKEHEVSSPLGVQLLDMRERLLSAGKVRDAYLGYARSQLKRLESRGDGTFSSNTANRSAKHARHMARLLEQGYDLYTTGRLSVRVADPDWYHDFTARGPEVWAKWFHRQAEKFEQASSCLPPVADVAAAEAWLSAVRRNFLD